MNLVRQRIDRILYISSELELMFKELVEETFAYPEWHLKEKPETIIQVTDNEMSTKLYVSPSQQDLLDKQVNDSFILYNVVTTFLAISNESSYLLRRHTHQKKVVENVDRTHN